MTLQATRAVDGHRIIPGELRPTPIVAFLESPRTGDDAVTDSGEVVVSGWAVSPRGRPIAGVLRLGDGSERDVTCEQPRPRVVEQLGLTGADERCGFHVVVGLPDGVDVLTARLELSDGEYIADAEPFRIRRRIAPQLSRAVPSVPATMAVFAGQWRTVPEDLQDASAIDDPRVRAGVEALGGVAGARVLVAGSGEGRECVVLEQCGAGAILGVEADRDAFVRSLALAQVAGLRATTLRYGAVGALLRDVSPASTERFDVVVALDFVHHQLEPTVMLELLAGAADRMLLGTRCFDGARIERLPELRRRFARPPVERDVRGRPVLVHRGERLVDDGALVRSPDPLGGWLGRDDLLGCFDALGFDVVIPPEVDDPDDPAGPVLVVAATRR